jgi:hypothetical protein
MKAAWMALGLMVACVSFAQTPKGGGTANISPSEESKPNKQAWQSRYPTNDDPLPIVVVQPQSDAARAAKREHDGEQFNKDYLDSQIRLAVASEKQATAARASTVITFIGTLVAALALCFLYRTYRETRNAADAARDQADISRDDFNVGQDGKDGHVGFFRTYDPSSETFKARDDDPDYEYN